MNKIDKKAEDEIIHLASEALRKRGVVRNGIESFALRENLKAGRQPDRRIKMFVNGKNLKYHAQVKATITNTQKLLFLINKEGVPCPTLLVTRHVNAEAAEELRLNGIEFIDTAGNAFLQQQQIYVFIKGNRPQKTGRAPVKRAFKAAGLKMIYGILCNPGLEKSTYREIAVATGVALGTVDWVLNELQELGFLIDRGKRGLQLAQRETLLQRWLTGYPEQLRPKQILGRFRGEQGWWQKKKIDPLRAQWGGEIAAEKLTHYLKPQAITLYANAQHLTQFILENRLKADPTGDVEILGRFWVPSEHQQPQDTVHPLLVYADLLATGDQRNLETAKMIYEKHLVRLIRED